MAHRGVELHRILPEGGVAVQAADLRIGRRERHPTPTVPNGPAFKPLAGNRVGID